METTAKCPICNNDIKITDFLYEVPYIGKVLLSVGRCSKCGFRINDIRVFEANGPKRLMLKVEKPNDINTLIVRASSASIKIPELGLEITPGPRAQGFITTIEGVLNMFREITETLCREPDVNKEVCKRKLKELDDAINGKIQFTFILEDPEGASKIIHEKVIEVSLS